MKNGQKKSRKQPGFPLEKAAKAIREKGFTLLECSVGIAVLGFILMTASPSLVKIIDQTSIDAASSQLAKDIILARMRAVQHRQSVDFQFDEEDGSYTFSPGGPTRMLPEGVVIIDAEDFTFDKRGYTGSGCITIQLNRSDKTHHLKVSSAGRVRVLR